MDLVALIPKERSSGLLTIRLSLQARLATAQNSLLTPEDRNRLMSWLLRTVRDQDSTELDKRRTLANYILSGQPTE